LASDSNVMLVLLTDSYPVFKGPATL
jgi:hypothetical protein